MTSHRWTAGAAPRATRWWRAFTAERARLADQELTGLAVVAGLAVLTAALRLVSLAGPGAGEARHVAQVFSADRLGTLLPAGTGPSGSPLAWLQMAAYTGLTDAFARHATALGAVRESMVFAAAVTAVLVWALARRMGLTRWTAAAAVALVAVSPAAIGLQHVVLPENLAAPWALAALVLLWTPSRHRRLAADLWATALLVVAVITAPVTLALATTAAWLVWRRGRRRLSLMLTALFTLGLGLGLGTAALVTQFQLSGEAAPPGRWLALEPVLPAAAVAAAVVAVAAPRLRPLAVGFLALLAVACAPGGPRAGAVALLVPLGAVLLAGVVETGLTVRTRTDRHRWGHPLRVPAVLIAAALVAVATPGLLGGLGAVTAGRQGSSATIAAAQWLRDNGSSTPVVTDEATWVALVQSGRDANTVALGASCCAEGAWFVVTPGQTDPRVAEALDRTEPVAVFGRDAERVEIRRPVSGGAASRVADEAGARVAAGTRLAGSTRLALGADAARELRAGAADPRILATLAALAATKPVRVTALPAVPGEDAAGQPRRQVLLAASGDPADQLVLFFRGQRGVFAPESVAATPDGVLVRYPPVAPSGLLTPFDSP